MIDRFGKCPHCGRDWKGKDVLDTISVLSVFSHLNKPALMGIASRYGYSEERKVEFSTVNIHIKEEGTFFQCPSIRCGHVFNSETGEEYQSLWHQKRGKLYEAEKGEEKVEDKEEKEDIDDKNYIDFSKLLNRNK